MFKDGGIIDSLDCILMDDKIEVHPSLEKETSCSLKDLPLDDTQTTLIDPAEKQTAPLSFLGVAPLAAQKQNFNINIENLLKSTYQFINNQESTPVQY